MRFEWDLRKATSNLRKHRLAFEQAITAFDDPLSLTTSDLKHSGPLEKREWLIGRTDKGLLVVLVFTIRGDGKVYRVISARPASRRERRAYEKLQGISV